MAGALVPLIPKQDTPALRGRPLSGQDDGAGTVREAPARWSVFWCL